MTKNVKKFGETAFWIATGIIGCVGLAWIFNSAGGGHFVVRFLYENKDFPLLGGILQGRDVHTLESTSARASPADACLPG